MNARAKGLAWCREVKEILISRGYRVDGPFYGAAFFGGKMVTIHRDIFGCMDLISYKDGQMLGHQVTDSANKSVHAKKMITAGVDGWLWCRNKDGRKVYWRVFYKGMEIPM